MSIPSTACSTLNWSLLLLLLLLLLNELADVSSPGFLSSLWLCELVEGKWHWERLAEESSLAQREEAVERAFQFRREMYIEQTIFCLPKEFQHQGFISLGETYHVFYAGIYCNLMKMNMEFRKFKFAIDWILTEFLRFFIENIFKTSFSSEKGYEFFLPHLRVRYRAYWVISSSQG